MQPSPHNLTLIWVCYTLGVVLTLALKWGKYCYDGKTKFDTKVGKSTLTWFFEGSAVNGVSWATTIGVVWVFGSAYINHVVWLFGSYVQSIPVEPPIAFLLGSLAELIAPAAVKWIMAKLTFGISGS